MRTELAASTLRMAADAHQLQLLSHCQDAVKWLATAAGECQKSENVDLPKIILHCHACAESVSQALAMEAHPVRHAALEQLASALRHQVQRLEGKREQLEQMTAGSGNPSAAGHHGTSNINSAGCRSAATTTAASGLSSSTGGSEDDHSYRRRRAVEDTIVAPGTISFDAVVGLQQAKQALREAMVLPLRFPNLFSGSCQPWRRVLLYGPPGTGKTRLAKAVSGEIESRFYCVSSSDLVSSWLGESEKIIRDLFAHARDNRGQSVIFIDEIDSVCRKRSASEEEHTRRIKTELLHQMEGALEQRGGQVFLLCATNCPWELDKAFLRRFQKRLYIPLPDKAARKTLLQMQCSGVPVSLSEGGWEELASRTEGQSGSDVATLVADALMQPVRELEQATHWKPSLGTEGLFSPCPPSDPLAQELSLLDLLPTQVRPRDVVMEDFIAALPHTSRTVTEEELGQYVAFTRLYGQQGM